MQIKKQKKKQMLIKKTAWTSLQKKKPQADYNFFSKCCKNNTMLLLEG